MLIAELQDFNDHFTHDEILKRVSIDQDQRSKNLIVYVLKAGATLSDIIDSQALAKPTAIPGLDEHDEVV